GPDRPPALPRLDPDRRRAAKFGILFLLAGRAAARDRADAVRHPPAGQGLALLSATAVKIFIFDVKELEDIWRILSLFGLGAAGIGIGKLYATVLRGE